LGGPKKRKEERRVSTTTLLVVKEWRGVEDRFLQFRPFYGKKINTPFLSYLWE